MVVSAQPPEGRVKSICPLWAHRVYNESLDGGQRLYLTAKAGLCLMSVFDRSRVLATQKRRRKRTSGCGESVTQFISQENSADSGAWRLHTVYTGKNRVFYFPFTEQL